MLSFCLFIKLKTSRKSSSVMPVTVSVGCVSSSFSSAWRCAFVTWDFRSPATLSSSSFWLVIKSSYLSRSTLRREDSPIACSSFANTESSRLLICLFYSNDLSIRFYKSVEHSSRTFCEYSRTLVNLSAAFSKFCFVAIVLSLSSSGSLTCVTKKSAFI